MSSTIAIPVEVMQGALLQMQTNVDAFGDVCNLFLGSLPGVVQSRLNLARPLGLRRCLVACLGHNAEELYTYMLHVEGEGTYVWVESFSPESVTQVQVDEHFVYLFGVDGQDLGHVEIEWAFLGSCRVWLRPTAKGHQIGVLSPANRFTVLVTPGNLKIEHLSEVWDTIRPGIVRLVRDQNEAADAWYAVFYPFQPKKEEVEAESRA